MIRVVTATEKEFPHVWQLSRELFAEESDKYPAYAAGMNERGVLLAYHRILGWCLDPSMVVLLAYADDVPVGYLQVEFTPFVGSPNAAIGKSIGFYVRPEWRKRATTLLYRWARKVYQANGCTKAQATVLTTNTETRMLYEAHGWKQVAIIYERDLTKVHPGEATDGERKQQPEGFPESSGSSNARLADCQAELFE